MATDTPTRFPKGSTNVLASHPLGRFKGHDPLKMHVYANDFDAYATADWTLSGAGTPTSALTAGDGGLLILTTTTVANDSAFLQKTPGAFTLAAGKQFWYRSMLTMADVTNSVLFAGVVNAGATAFAPTDGFWFSKANATTQLVFNYKAASGSVSATVNLPTTPATYQTYNDAMQSGLNAAFLPIANNVQFTLGVHYDGVSKFTIYYNDAAVGSYSLASGVSPTAVTLAPAHGVTNGGATAAKTLTIDGFVTAKERF